nr:matrixin family metalloprotease [uncultured Pseudoteredinibacter sp.]
MRILCLAFALLAIYFPSPQSLAFTLLGPKWENGKVTFDTSFPEPNPSTHLWSKAMRQAATEWGSSVENLNITFTNNDYHPCAGMTDSFPADGGKNAGGFHINACGEDFGQDVIAINFSTSLNSTYQESDIVFNSNRTWAIYDGNRKTAIDFKRVALHEFGHLIGLDHENSAAAIMRPYTSDRFTLSEDDLAGARTIYAPSTVDNGTPPPTSSHSKTVLEEPTGLASVSGVSNIRGWAISPDGIRKVELFIDEQLITTLPYGGSRPDVAKQYPGVPDSDKSGFSMAVNWGNLSPGQHRIEVRVHSKNSTTAATRTSSTFTVQAFDQAFLTDPNSIQILGEATVTGSRNITLQQVKVNGKTYRVDLNWNTATQKWDIADIDK